MVYHASKSSKLATLVLSREECHRDQVKLPLFTLMIYIFPPTVKELQDLLRFYTVLLCLLRDSGISYIDLVFDQLDFICKANYEITEY